MINFIAITVCFIFTLAAANNPYQLPDVIRINCGSADSSVALHHDHWLGDRYDPSFVIKGYSTGSTAMTRLNDGTDPVPYKTVRISRYEFSYTFQGCSGQKLIRLHFYPARYNGFELSEDKFSVKAGPFTLLTNFTSAQYLTFVTKEFLMILEENYPLNISFFPENVFSHAFVNGIEVISVPETFSNFHTGVQVVGEEFMVYIDNCTELEIVHRVDVETDSVSSGEDFRGTFNREETGVSSITWRVSVDVRFRHLVRLYLSDLGLDYNKSLLILINEMVVYSNANILEESADEQGVICRNYMVMGKGCKLLCKYDLIISIQSNEEFIHGHVPLRGFEILKLSNQDNSFTCPNHLPRERKLAFWIIGDMLSVLGSKSGVSTVVIVSICLVIHILRQIWETNFSKQEKMPITSISRTCRCFLLSEIHIATENFNDAFVIGRGGFGKVYKGFLNNGEEIVAIKRMKLNSKQGKCEFWTEVETLSEVRHVNLVSLIGYCNEQQEMILVYDYMPNGTLSDHLYKLARKNSNYSYLSWEERLKICIGAARGLDYLHTGKGIIHRDVKSSNILLDETFVAKVSDFGLAKTESLSLESTNLKGTFGYMDPAYFKTHKLTTKSDTYAFGVVLLEVLCGRPAVDPVARVNERSLTTWAQDKIGRGKVDKILAPPLSGIISPDSLKVFLRVVESCLLDEPNKRPTIGHVVINLEFAFEKQKDNSLVASDIVGLLHRTPFMDSPLASSHLQNMSPVMKEQTNSRLVNGEPQNEKRYGQKSITYKIWRLLPWDSVRKSSRVSSGKDHARISISAPILEPSRSARESPSRRNSTCRTKKLSTDIGTSNLIPIPCFRIFSFSELKVATRNFREDSVVKQGNFGRIYKGFLKVDSSENNRSGSIVAVKRLSPEGLKGFKEWMSEINFLGQLSHPNLVKLLGYCNKDKELLLVYEFVKNGNFGNHLFPTRSSVQAVPWNIRLKILTGAARGLSYLHNLAVPLIYRDFKIPNILLDESYNAKLSHFGLAKSGPSAAHTHVLTGQLTVKSDIYGFGVVLLEMLTGLRALDRTRPPGQQSLVEWIKPCFNSRNKLMDLMDSRLEGSYPAESAMQIYQLAKNCLEYKIKAIPSITEVVEILEAVAKLESL